jgi:hypothetical protein
MIRTLAFGLEDDLQQPPEIARGPTFQLEPAKAFGR